MTPVASMLLPDEKELREVFALKYGACETTGWGPRARLSKGYFTPDDVYEAVVRKLVGEDCTWLDVGCGRDLFPSNPALARALSGNCKLLVGVDPSPNILENTFVHERHQSGIEDLQTAHRFDLVTMRMVAEHVENPTRMLDSLRRVIADNGRVVIYTVNRYSPIALLSSLLPFCFHHPLKRLVWRSEEKDTFPTAYRINTRKALRAEFERAGFVEESFSYLDDCRTFARWPIPSSLELRLWRALRVIGLPYPETCLLGIYRKHGGPAVSC